jgi:hypothetical protein
MNMPYKKLRHPIAITDQEWPKGVEPVVSVCVITFNHARFIAQCLGGILAQRTTFPVEIVVHDDASTDGTVEIIKDYKRLYPALFRLIFQSENQWSKGRKPSQIVVPACRGRFISICEGDDYWIFPEKLERQIAIFEEKKSCLLVGGRAFVYRDGYDHSYAIHPACAPDVLESLTPTDVLKGKWYFKTLTRVAPRYVWDAYFEVVGNSDAQCDWLFVLFCVAFAQQREMSFSCLEEIVGVYREHSGGVWSMAGEEEQLLANLQTLAFALDHFEFSLGEGAFSAVFFRSVRNWVAVTDARLLD